MISKIIVGYCSARNNGKSIVLSYNCTHEPNNIMLLIEKENTATKADNNYTFIFAVK